MIKYGRCFVQFTCLLLIATMIMPLSASAAHYAGYSTVSYLPNGSGSCCGVTQAFALGSTYVYSVKINNDDTKAVIYMTTKSDGTNVLMTNGDDGTTIATYLGHANDMVIKNIGGQNYFFIVTMKEGSMSLMKLSYTGTTYNKVGNYTIKLNGVNKAMSGVKITGAADNNLQFLFKSGTTFYRGTLPETANSGTINVTSKFTLNITNALVNGSTIPNITDYLTQGFAFYDNSIYLPLTHENISVILVYRNITSTTSGTQYADNNLSFRITSAAFPDLFEIEGVGVAAGNSLWFNTNRRTQPGDIVSDGVHYFNDYIAP